MKTQRLRWWLWVLMILFPIQAHAGPIGSGSSNVDPFDPSTSMTIVEEFNVGLPSSGSIGTNGWALGTIGSTPTVSRINAETNAPMITQLLTASGATQGQGGAVSLMSAGGAAIVNGLGGVAGWDSYFRARIISTADTRARIGYMVESTTVPPSTWMGLRYDTNTAQIYGDTHFWFVCSTTDVSKNIESAGNAGAVRVSATSVVTITLTATHTFAVGDAITIAGVTDSSFNGQFFITSAPTTTSLTYTQAGANATSGSGTALASKTTAVDTTIPADTAFHKLRMRSLVAGTVLFTLYNASGVAETAETAISSNCPGASLQLLPAFQIVTDATAQKKMDLEFFSFRMTGLTR